MQCVFGFESYRRFNEAAGVPRGIHERRWSVRPTVPCFNEAAGVPRGILPVGCGWIFVKMPASMRPREFPAEST